MTNEEFQRWLAGVEQLTAAQRERLQQVAQEQGDEAASRAAIELRVDGVALAGEPGVPLARLVEADETCFRHSRKGERNLDRKPLRCGWPRPAGAGRRARCWRRPARRTCRRRWSRCWPRHRAGDGRAARAAWGSSTRPSTGRPGSACAAATPSRRSTSATGS